MEALTVGAHPNTGPMPDLTSLEREYLAFADLRWKQPGARDEEIRRRWDLSPARYSQILNHLIDQPAAEVYAPQLVRRLQRLRARRKQVRVY